MATYSNDAFSDDIREYTELISSPAYHAIQGMMGLIQMMNLLHSGAVVERYADVSDNIQPLLHLTGGAVADFSIDSYEDRYQLFEAFLVQATGATIVVQPDIHNLSEHQFPLELGDTGEYVVLEKQPLTDQDKALAKAMVSQFPYAVGNRHGVTDLPLGDPELFLDSQGGFLQQFSNNVLACFDLYMGKEEGAAKNKADHMRSVATGVAFAMRAAHAHVGKPYSSQRMTAIYQQASIHDAGYLVNIAQLHEPIDALNDQSPYEVAIKAAEELGFTGDELHTAAEALAVSAMTDRQGALYNDAIEKTGFGDDIKDIRKHFKDFKIHNNADISAAALAGAGGAAMTQHHEEWTSTSPPNKEAFTALDHFYMIFDMIEAGFGDAKSFEEAIACAFHYPIDKEYLGFVLKPGPNGTSSLAEQWWQNLCERDIARIPNQQQTLTIDNAARKQIKDYLDLVFANNGDTKTALDQYNDKHHYSGPFVQMLAWGGYAHEPAKLCEMFSIEITEEGYVLQETNRYSTLGEYLNEQIAALPELSTERLHADLKKHHLRDQPERPAVPANRADNAIIRYSAQENDRSIIPDLPTH